MENKIIYFCSCIYFIIIVIIFITYCRNIKKELKQYEKELETIKTEKIKVIEDSIEDIKKRNIEFENSNAKLKAQLRRLNELSPTDRCLTQPIDDNVIKLLRDADI